VRSFFLDEAQEAEEDEEEEEEEEEFVSEKERREITQAEADAIAKHARRLAMNQAFETKTAAEIAEDIKNRYRTNYQTRGEYFEGARSEYATSEVTQKSLVPGVGDPTVWMLRCKPGLEMQLVRSILLKSLKAKSMGKRVGLKSAFCGNSKGYIYLEAFEEVSVREAIQGLTSLYHSSLKIVPIQQMTSLLTITVKKRPLKAGQWVRIKRGELKGDLAKVLSLNEGGETAVIQAVPRIDFTPNVNKPPGSKSARPLQAPFDPSRVNSSLVERRQFPPTGETCNYYERNFYKNGFLLKEVKIDLYLSDENVSPKLEELTMFRQRSGRKTGGGSDDEGDADDQDDAQQPSVVQELAELQAADSAFGLSKKQVSLYRPGDLVQITSGDLRNMVGRIVSLSDTDRIVRVKPVHEVDLGEMDVEMDLIVKYIRPGSHVKVIDGEFVGQTGRVVCINKVDGSHIAALFTDVVNKEISVNVAHLQVSNEVTIGLNSLEGYELYDFVTLSANEVGVVVMVGTEKLSIVNHLGELKVVTPMEVRGKANIQSMRATSIDNMMEVMHVGDSVTVMEGPHAKKTGTIKHIHKSTVWLHCDTYFANAGIFPVRGRSCALAGSNRNAGSGSMGPPTSMPRGRGFGGKNGGKDEIIGASVTISKGAYKGHIAVVREASDTDYTLELATKLKIIKLPKENVVVAGNKTGPLHRQAPSTQLGIASTPYISAHTPAQGSSTPSMSFLGSETPLNFGNETPRGSETPSGGYGYVDVWRPHESDISLSRAGSASGSGPAMSPGASAVAGQTMSLFAPPTPSGGSSLSHYDWDRPMLVTFTTGGRTGQTGVLRGKVNTVIYMWLRRLPWCHVATNTSMSLFLMRFPRGLDMI
jgi:transcription elongation factor SPT5